MTWWCTSNSSENDDFWQTCSYLHRLNQYIQAVRFSATRIISKGNSWSTTYEKHIGMLPTELFAILISIVKSKIWQFVFSKHNLAYQVNTKCYFVLKNIAPWSSVKWYLKAVTVGLLFVIMCDTVNNFVNHALWSTGDYLWLLLAGMPTYWCTTILQAVLSNCCFLHSREEPPYMAVQVAVHVLLTCGVHPGVFRCPCWLGSDGHVCFFSTECVGIRECGLEWLPLPSQWWEMQMYFTVFKH